MRWKKILALGMVAFWALVTNHCNLEHLPGFELIACSIADTEPHQPSDCGETDSCATVEDGLYKTEESKVSAKRVVVSADALSLALLYNSVAPNSPAGQAAARIIPPELSQIWQFSFRTALPPRAPSLLS